MLAVETREGSIKMSQLDQEEIIFLVVLCVQRNGEKEIHQGILGSNEGVLLCYTFLQWEYFVVS